MIRAHGETSKAPFPRQHIHMQFLQVGEQTDMAALSVRDDRSSPDAFVAFPLRYRDLQELPLSIADGRSQAEVL